MFAVKTVLKWCLFCRGGVSPPVLRTVTAGNISAVCGRSKPLPYERPFIFLLKYYHLFLQNLGSVEPQNLHRIPSVGSPLWSVWYRISFRQKKKPCLLVGRQGEQRKARHLKTSCVLCGGRYVRSRGREAFAPRKRKSPYPPGMPKGSQPLGAVSFPSFLYRSKESLMKSL